MATRKTSARKTKTSKTTVKKSSVAASAANQSLVQRVLRLNTLHIVSVILFAGLAVAAALLMQAVSFPLAVTHLTNDALLSQDSTVFAIAHRNIVDVQLRWILVSVLALSVVLPVLYLTKLKDYYAKTISKGRVNGLRWIDLAVSSALMVEIIMLLVGYNDLMMLKLAGGLIGVTCALGWLAEKQNATGRKPVWNAFVISLVTGALPWIAIGASKIATVLYGSVRNPWYVYALCVTALAGFILLAVNQWNGHRRFRGWANYAVVERNYVLISLITKTTFAVILIAGLSK